MKPIKLDRRMLGFGYYKYSANFKRNDCGQFIKIRTWCWEQWGPSCEFYFFTHMETKPVWTWVADHHNRYRIFFETDRECSWYILNWLNK